MTPKGSILVVDDELGPRESLRMILKSCYEVHAVSSGPEAIQFINREKVDLVTLDLKMPGMSGIETLKRIRLMDPDVMVIIITGFGTLQSAVEAIRHTAFDFIAKPFNVKEIVGIVEVCAAAHPDPLDDSGTWECVDVRAVADLPRPVPLRDVKRNPKLATMALVASSRLSVQPVTREEWEEVCRMGGLTRNEAMGE